MRPKPAKRNRTFQQKVKSREKLHAPSFWTKPKVLRAGPGPTPLLWVGQGFARPGKLQAVTRPPDTAKNRGFYSGFGVVDRASARPSARPQRDLVPRQGRQP